jgi:hypothetical protein
MGLHHVTELPIVVDCEFSGFEDYWAARTSGQGRLSARLNSLVDDLRGEIKRHVSARYLAGLPDGPRTLPMVIRAVRGIVPG